MKASQGMAVLVAMILACAPAPSGSAGQDSPAPASAPKAATSDRVANGKPTVEELQVELVGRYPHDRDAFTQGLLWHEGHLYESLGRHGQSDVRRVDLASGHVVASYPLSAELFGEGLARVGDRLIQLSYKAGIATVYDLESLAPIDQYAYDGEGWGLAYDEGAGRLVMSDGSQRLTFRDPHSFASLGNLEVTLEGRPLSKLNELEAIDGAVWANVWYQERIVRIDLQTGRVTATANLRGLLGRSERLGTDVLNGIAYNSEADLFFVTGKLWPALFAIRLTAPTR